MNCCSICQEEIPFLDFCTLECGHDFHLKCIIHLTRTESNFSNKCPNCREPFWEANGVDIDIDDVVLQMSDGAVQEGDVENIRNLWEHRMDEEQQDHRIMNDGATDNDTTTSSERVEVENIRNLWELSFEDQTSLSDEDRNPTGLDNLRNGAKRITRRMLRVSPYVIGGICLFTLSKHKNLKNNLVDITFFTGACFAIAKAIC